MTLPQVLMIDNYDSFTFNLVHYLEQLNVEVIVRKNDEISIEQIEQLSPAKIILSPGPCTPNKAGICLQVVDRFKGQIPILGVCLGHQVIAQSFGARIIKADKVMHGKTSKILHNEKGVFKNLPQKFVATRYHSLVVDQNTLQKEIEVTAWTEDDRGQIATIMGIKHKEFDLEGIQFHPESILSEKGLFLLKNFLVS